MPKYKISLDGGLRFVIEAPSLSEAYNMSCVILTGLTIKPATNDALIIEEIKENEI